MSARPVIDAVEFARTHGELSGVLPLSGFARLADQLARSDGSVTYRLSGKRDGEQPQLWLELQGELCMACQRCLGELLVPLQVRHGFVLVGREQDLSELNDEADDIDEIVASGAFDVAELIEDEMLLALPYAPRHESCTPAAALESGAQESKFADLAALRSKGGE